MTGYEARYHHQLSGGQQQRVALARAVAYEPDVLLLDESFSNLDAKLRKSMRLQLRKLQQRLALTTIFVIHDQQEALSLSDVVAVINHGKLEQVGIPSEVYQRLELPGAVQQLEFVEVARDNRRIQVDDLLTMGGVARQRITARQLRNELT